MQTIVNIERRGKSVATLNTDEAEMLDLNIDEMRDFDTASHYIAEILGSYLEGPDQMRLVKFVAEAFLGHYGEQTDLLVNQYDMLANLVHTHGEAS